MDLFMRLIDGFETTRRLREIPTLQHIVIIAISAGAYTSIRRKSLEAGCDDFLSKPFQLATLLECLHTHLNLTWMYQHEEASIFTDHPEQRESIVLPPQNLLDELEKYARIGYVSGVDACLDKIQQLESTICAICHSNKPPCREFSL